MHITSYIILYPILFLILMMSISVHEAAHALSAKWLGDRTPQKMGRISLNPARHISVWGFLAFFILRFGWGKPVEVNLYNFRKPKLYFLLSSLAGPVSNLLVAAVAFAALHVFENKITYFLLVIIFEINIMLAVFNLLPIPPLDGSKLWPCIIPGARAAGSGKFGNIGMLLLLVGIFTGTISKVITPTMDFFDSLVPPLRENKPPPDSPPKIIDPPADTLSTNYQIFKPENDRPYYLTVFSALDKYPADKLTGYVETQLALNGWKKTQPASSEPIGL